MSTMALRLKQCSIDGPESLALRLRRASSIDGNPPLVLSHSGSVAAAQPDGKPLPAACLQSEALQAVRIVAWCRRTPEVAAVLGDRIKAHAISGGLTNCAYIVEGSKGKLFVKQAEAFHKVATAIPLSLARLATEAMGIKLGHTYVPEAVPGLVHYDPAASILVAEFKEGLEMMSSALLRGAVYPGLGARLGSAMARLAFGASPEVMGRRAFAALEAAVEESASVADVMTDHTLILPFDRAAPHNSWPAELGPEVEAGIYGDAALMAEVAVLRALRASPGARCFLHTDAWVNNILVPEWAEGTPAGEELALVDFEFGTVGPNSYDIGHTIGTLLLAAITVRGYADAGAGGGAEGAVPRQRRAEQEEWLVASAAEAWAAFCGAWAAQAKRRMPWQRRPAAPPLADAVGYAGIVVVRWSIGQFNIFRNLGLEDGTPAYTAAVRAAVRVGGALIRRRHEIGSADEIAAIARAEMARAA
ncbi:MAG: kinase-like domain-containing protein [Monoraphidium minutum]|nr:MAG: kinase-like domain-containing protein [Monoraphidium minutum]